MLLSKGKVTTSTTINDDDDHHHYYDDDGWKKSGIRGPASDIVPSIRGFGILYSDNCVIEYTDNFRECQLAVNTLIGSSFPV